MNAYSFAEPDPKDGGAKEKATVSCDFLSANEKLALKCADEDSVTADILALKTGLPAYELIGICVNLCQKGVFKSVGAGRFVVSSSGSKIKEAL